MSKTANTPLSSAASMSPRTRRTYSEREMPVDYPDAAGPCRPPALRAFGDVAIGAVVEP